MQTTLSYDCIVIGSGAAAMTAAVTAAHAGLEVLVVEKAPRFGGTSARSGGVAFLPGNPLIPEEGEQDGLERALRYFESIVGEQRMRPEVMSAFYLNAGKMVDFFQSSTELQFERTTYPDYKSHLDGGMDSGRSLAAQNYDGRRLGPWFERLEEPLKELCVLNHMMVDGMDLYHLMNMTRSFASFRHAAGRFCQYLADRTRYPRGARLTMGTALMGRLLKSAVDAGDELWHSAPARRLTIEKGRVSGAIVEKDGRELSIQARRGVVLATGGFANDPDMKRRFIPFSETHETFSTDTVTGDGIHMGIEAGAVMGDHTAMFHSFLGTQVSKLFDGNGHLIDKALFMRRDRNKPGFILVTRHGRRFVNEAWPYNDVAHVMNHTEGAVPSFLICDHTRLRRYGLGLVRPGPGWLRPLGRFLRNDHLVRADTIRELAKKLDISADSLEETVRTNNDYARTGKDPEFGKGDTVYDRWQGDPAVSPNPNLGPIEDGPFYGVRLWPGNLGTFLGLETDERARVLDSRKEPIPGLYACGCDMHHMLTGSYAGGGSSIGPGMTFGFIAARDMADANPQPAPENGRQTDFEHETEEASHGIH